MIYTDNDILLGFAEKDQKIFEAIYKRYYYMVYSVCWKICDNMQECEDRVSLIFTHFFNGKAVFESIDKLEAYLCISARNNAYSAVRDAKYQRNKKIEYMNSVDEQWSIINDRLDHRYIKELKLIKESMENNPIRSIQVLKMIYFENKTYAQIEEILGITFSTVSNLRTQGIIHLQKLINRESI